MKVNANKKLKYTSYKNNSNITILTLHGYLESNEIMSYFSSHFKNKNYNVENPNLLGHAGKYTDLHRIKYSDWVKQIEDLYKKLKAENNKVVIIGHSLGGMLALYLGENYYLDGIVLINHLFNHLPLSIMTTPIGKYFLKYVPNRKIKQKKSVMA